MESVWSVSKLSTESVGSRRELVTLYRIADADATKKFRRVGVTGVYWALSESEKYKLSSSTCTSARVFKKTGSTVTMIHVRSQSRSSSSSSISSRVVLVEA